MCHFIADSKVNSYVLQTRALEEWHSAANLADYLKTSVEQWGLGGKGVACVHDNASNMVAANRDVDWESLPCFAHTLQLAINDGFKAASMNRLVHVVNLLDISIIAWLPQMHSNRNRELELPSHKLVQCCKMRWNSAADMLAGLHEQCWAITAVLSDRTTTKLADAKTLELIDDHWQPQTIEEILPVLQSLKIASEALGGKNYLSVSILYPLVQSFLSRFRL